MTSNLAEFSTRFPALAAESGKGDLDALLASMSVRQLVDGETVIKDGGRVDSLYFVMEGTLNCFLEKDGEKAQIGRIVPGQFIGEVSILDDGPASATVIADSPCSLYELAKPQFQALEKTNPAIASTLLRTIIKLLVERLRSSDRLFYDMLTDKEQPSVESAHTNFRAWVLHIYGRLSGYEGAKK